jgi:hypothetical protein
MAVDADLRGGIGGQMQVRSAGVRHLFKKLGQADLGFSGGGLFDTHIFGIY